MNTPTRLQLSRKKSFKLQSESHARNGLACVNVARPSIFGNPFKLAQAIEAGYLSQSTPRPEQNAFLRDCFRDWLLQNAERTWWQGPDADRRRQAIAEGLAALRGKNLACWCPPGAPCHADVLLELANRM